MSDGDKAECKEIAREIIREVMVEHVAACPHGQRLSKILFAAFGIGVGSGVGSSGIALALLKVFGGN